MFDVLVKEDSVPLSLTFFKVFMAHRYVNTRVEEGTQSSL